MYTNPKFYEEVERFHAQTGKDLKKAGKWSLVFLAAMLLLIFTASCGKSYEVVKESGDTVTTCQSLIGDYNVGDSVKVTGVNCHGWKANGRAHTMGVYGKVISVK